MPPSKIAVSRGQVVYCCFRNLHIVCTSISYQIYDLQHPPSFCLLFYPTYIMKYVLKFFCEVQFVSLPLLLMPLVCYSRSHHTHNHGKFWPSIFSQEFYSFRSYTQIPDPILNSFCICAARGFQFILLHVRLSFPNTICCVDQSKPYCLLFVFLACLQ